MNWHMKRRDDNTVSICRQHDCLPGKSLRTYQKFLELSEFSKVKGYKIITQKSIAFLYADNETK